MKITIPIIPTAQMRARHSAVNGYSRTYKAKKQTDNEDTIKTFLLQFRPETALTGQILLGVKAYMPIPQSMPRRQREDALSGLLRPTTRPDLDNLLKNVTDCLTQMAFWEDDKQVVGYLPQTGKYYSDNPRWELEIVELKEVQG